MSTKMAKSIFLTHLLLVCFSALFLANESSIIKALTQSDKVAGVFLLSKGGQYALNFTNARAACLFLNVTMATRDQMQRAVQQGLETCKYGWIAERVAAIPRLTSDNRCGNGNTGVVLWRAAANKEFGVFCFDVSALVDSDETTKAPTASPQTSTSAPFCTVTALSQTSRPPTATESAEQRSFTSAFTLLVKTTHSPRISSTPTSLRHLSTHIPTSLSHLITSKPTVVTFALSTSGSGLTQSGGPERTPLGALPTALIVLGVLLLLVAAAGTVWYCKQNLFTVWCLGQHRDDTETEMWKHADSEMDLHSQHQADEDEELRESDRKYSSDITLCVNPDIKRNISE